jgi:hypothetical protein
MENNTNAQAVAYTALSNAKLINLMFTGADQLPMEFACEVIARGTRIIAPMAKIIAEPKNWERGDAGWCAVLHSVFLTGAIGGKEAVTPLIDAIFSCCGNQQLLDHRSAPRYFRTRGAVRRGRA